MKIGIAVPLAPSLTGELLLEWGRRADAGPFSSIGTGDRIAYSCFELMAMLAALAAVTRRVRLFANVLALPLRNAGIVAKEAATIDSISGGRLTLGVGVGGREEDFMAAPAALKRRGPRFEEQLALMKRIWSGEAPGENINPIGPLPVQTGGPELLIGAFNPKAVRRVGRWADGLTTFDFEANATTIRRYYDIAEEAWRDGGRSGSPRFVAGLYYALGPDAEDRLHSFISDYYGYFGPAVSQSLAKVVPTTTPQAIKDAVRAFSDIGTDELVLVATSPNLDQLERLAELVA